MLYEQLRLGSIIFIGGGIGSVSRWLCGVLLLRLCGTNFPYGTMAVNLVGCLIIGIIAKILFLFPNNSHDLRLFLMTGILGGFTTFSAFSLDVVNLWMGERSNMSAIYLSVSVIGAILFTSLGLWLGDFMLEIYKK